MSTLKEERGDLPSLVQKLSQASGRADQGDLSGLAKMHTWCEMLADSKGLPGETVSAEVRAAAKKTAGLVPLTIGQE